MKNSTKVILLIFLILLLPRLNTGSLEDESNNSHGLKELSTSNFITTPMITNVQNPDFKTSSPPIAYCSGNYSDSGEDLDGNLLFNRIVLFMEIVTSESFSPLVIDLIIQPQVQGVNFNSTIKSLMISVSRNVTEGVHNITIPIVNAQYLHTLGHNLSFHIERIKLSQYLHFEIPMLIFTEYNTYTTRGYLPTEFDFFLCYTGKIWDRGENTDFNLRYDHLLIEIEVKVGIAGEYRVEIALTPKSDNGMVIKGVNKSYYDEGINIITISLDAAVFRSLRMNDSLVITEMKAYDENNTVVALGYPDYVTQVYHFNEFDVHLIDINGDEEFRNFAKNENLLGDGNPSNPYIINGFVISGSTSYNSITIENVNVSFQITNNILQGSVIGIKLHNLTRSLIANNSIPNNQIGIYLENVEECNIRYNTISKNNEGLALVESDKNIIDSNTFDENTCGISISSSNNNFITNNSLSRCRGKNMTGLGILIEESSYNNSVARNDFRANHLDVYDSGQNNTFTSNFWARWLGEGYFWIPGDYFGVYISSKNRDSFPSSTVNHILEPIIFSPLGGEIIMDPVLVIRWTTSDSLGHTLTYYIYFSANDGGNWIILKAESTSRYFSWNVRNVTEGSEYRIKISVYDSLGFSISKISGRFTIQIPPNPTPFISPLFATLILIFVCISLLLRFK